MSFRDWLKKQMEPGPPDPTWDPRGHDKWYIEHGEPFEPASSIGTEYLKAQSHCGTPDPEPTPEPEPEPPRHWLIRDGQGITLGTATELDADTPNRFIAVVWNNELPGITLHPDRTRWVDLDALEQDLTGHYARRFNITQPVRLQWVSRGIPMEDFAWKNGYERR